MAYSPNHSAPSTGRPGLGSTGDLGYLRSQRFRHHALRSQRAVAVDLRSQAHPCCSRRHG